MKQNHQAPESARPLANSTEHEKRKFDGVTVKAESVKEKIDSTAIKAENIKANGTSTKDSVSNSQPALATTARMEDLKPHSTPSTKASNGMAETLSSKPGVASTVEILDDDMTDSDQPMPVILPSPAKYFTSNNEDSIVLALNRILASVKRGGPVDATQDFSDESDSPGSNRKRRKRNTSVANYKRCPTPFTFSLNAVGDGFLHTAATSCQKRVKDGIRCPDTASHHYPPWRIAISSMVEPESPSDRHL